jgi:hypothetical protein
MARPRASAHLPPLELTSVLHCDGESGFCTRTTIATYVYTVHV